MRYRFHATSRDGGVRSGLLDATDELDAIAQLKRRALTMVKLMPETADAPVHVKAQAPPPPRPAAPARKSALPDGFQLDRKKVGLALAMGGLLVAGALGLGSWMVGDKTYHLHLDGQALLVTKSELGDDYWDRVKVELTLPNPPWKVDRTGAVQVKGSGGRYYPSQHQAKVNFQIGVEGNFTMDIDLALPQPPGKGLLTFEAPGFPLHKKTAAFAASDGGLDYRSQIDPVVIKRLKKSESHDAPVGKQQAMTTTSQAPVVNPDGREADE